MIRKCVKWRFLVRVYQPFLKMIVEIFGMEIDKKLNFSSHISNVCKKINNQLNVMLRFRKIIPGGTLLKLYKAFILPYFYYCSSVWHFCTVRPLLSGHLLSGHPPLSGHFPKSRIIASQKLHSIPLFNGHLY